MPVQLAFRYDLIFCQKCFVDWECIKALRMRQALENNTCENKQRLEHEYKVGVKVLILFKPYELCNNPKISPSTYARDPYHITENLVNGTVRIECGSYQDIISIRRIMPYKEN